MAGLRLRRRRPPRSQPRPTAGSLLVSFLFVAVFLGFAYLAGAGDPEVVNATEPLKVESAKEGSFADMIDRALEKEFPENEQNGGGSCRSELTSLCLLGFSNAGPLFFSVPFPVTDLGYRYSAEFLNAHCCYMRFLVSPLLPLNLNHFAFLPY